MIRFLIAAPGFVLFAVFCKCDFAEHHLLCEFLELAPFPCDDVAWDAFHELPRVRQNISHFEPCKSMRQLDDLCLSLVDE